MHLNNENYFSPESSAHYMSATQFKQFLECESMAVAIAQGKYATSTSTALLIGSYVDAHFSSTLDIFKSQNPGIYKRDGTLKSEYEHANHVIERIERDEMFMSVMSGESQRVMTGEIEGIPFKIKIDSLLPDMTVDLKIVKDFEPVYVRGEGYRSFWMAWRYDIQGAIYQFIRAQNESGEIKPFGIAGATKEKPEPAIGLFKLPQSELNAALDEVRENVVYYDMLKKGLAEPTRCEQCAWCRTTKKLSGWEEAS